MCSCHENIVVNYHEHTTTLSMKLSERKLLKEATSRWVRITTNELNGGGWSTMFG